LSNERRMVISDVPGIIEGAHHGKGLGLDFLRHVERNLLLFFFIDLSGDVGTDIDMIFNEIDQYSDGVLKSKPYILIGTKADIATPESIEIIKIRGGDIISSITGEGIKNLMEKAYKIIDEIRNGPKEDDVRE